MLISVVMRMPNVDTRPVNPGRGWESGKDTESVQALEVWQTREASLFTFQNGPAAGSLLTPFDAGKSLTSLYHPHCSLPTGPLIPASAETAKTFALAPDHLETFSNHICHSALTQERVTSSPSGPEP